ncbi:hypothetical protein EYF80_065554 [Liparis tanakae]|uniref:Uncharacterized protein n=1 Tax=Liparis tanakae TaxID=230148 RepID=A0A4Z2E6Q2_9TELE|nr:hypothetical protein EYF80_065554 [Liparis tanakae]
MEAVSRAARCAGGWWRGAGWMLTVSPPPPPPTLTQTRDAVSRCSCAPRSDAPPRCPDSCR